MLQRTLLIAGMALAALATYLIGPAGHLALVLPFAGAISLPTRAALLSSSVLAVFFGCFDGAKGNRRGRSEAALPPALLTLGFFLAGPVLGASLGLPHWWPAVGLGAGLVLALPLAWAAASPWLNPLAVNGRLFFINLASLLIFVGACTTGGREIVLGPILGFGGAALALLLWRPGLSAGIPEIDSSADKDTTVTSLLANGAVVGLVVAQVAWPLLHWPLPAVVSGLGLWAAFYAAAGMLSPGRKRRGGWAPAWEYGLAGAFTLAVVLIAVLRLA